MRASLSDNGHQTDTATGHLNEWAYNNLAAELDHAYQAALVASLAGKAIARGF